MGIPKNGWFISSARESPIKLDDLGVPPLKWKPPYSLPILTHKNTPCIFFGGILHRLGLRGQLDDSAKDHHQTKNGQNGDIFPATCGGHHIRDRFLGLWARFYGKSIFVASNVSSNMAISLGKSEETITGGSCKPWSWLPSNPTNGDLLK